LTFAVSTVPPPLLLLVLVFARVLMRTTHGV